MDLMSDADVGLDAATQPQQQPQTPQEPQLMSDADMGVGHMSDADMGMQPQQEAPIQDPSMLGAAARGALREAAPTTGAVVSGNVAAGAAESALEGTELGARLGSRAGPYGAIAGGLAGAVGGGYLASKGQDWVLDKLGLRNASGTLTSAFNPAQEQADIQQHPYATEIGSLLDTLLSLGTGSGQAIPKIQRALSAGIMGVGEAGQEAYNDGSINPGKVLLAAGAGAAAPVPRGWVSSLGGKAAGAVAGLKGTGTGAEQAAVATEPGTPGRPDLGGQEAEGAGQDDIQVANDLTTTAPGIAAENAPAPEISGAGNPVGAPMVARTAARPSDPERNYGKSAPAQAQGIETTPSQPNISVGDVDPTVSAALATAEPPAAAAPPTPPIDTGLGATDKGATPPQPPAPAPTQPVAPPAAQPPARAARNAAIQQELQPQQAVPQLDPKIASIVDTPFVQGAMEHAATRPIEVRPMPSGANSSKDITGPVYVDPSIPEQFRQPLAVHETVEQLLMAQGMKYPDAHRVATAAEHAAVVRAGLDWNEYTKSIDGSLSATEHSHPTDLPTDLHVSPEGADDANMNAHHMGKDEVLQQLINPPQADVTAPVTVAPKPIKGLPRLVQKALQFAADNNMSQVHAGIANASPADQLRMAKIIEAARVAQRKAAARQTVNGKVANTPALAATRQSALDAAEKAVAAYPPDNVGVVPKTTPEKQALRSRLQNMLDAAKAANGGVDPLTAYRPQEQTPAWQILKSAKNVLARWTPDNIKAHVASEQLLSGSPEAEIARMTQDTNRIDADIAFKGEVPDNVSAAAPESRPAFEPFRNEDQEESQVYTDQQNEMRGWLRELSADDFNDLHAKNPDMELEVNTTQDPGALLQHYKDDLTELVSPYETPGVQKGAPKTPAEDAPELGSKDWWKTKAADLLDNTSGSGKPLTSDNLSKILRGSGPQSTDSAPLLKRIFSPASISDTAKEAAALIRAKSGLRARDLAEIGAKLEPLRQVVNEQPEATRIKFMEALDTGAKIPDPKLQPLADKLRAAFYTTRVQLEDLGHEGVEFLNDYFPHMFKDPIDGNQFMQDWWAHQGSSGSLKHRTFPTIADALKAGYKLASTDPIDVSLRYLSSMRNYIEAQQTLRAAKTQGYVKAFFDIPRKGASGHPQGGTDVPLGWAPLKGRAENQSLYAPEDWARVYNAYVSRGFGQNPEAGQLYETLQHASNAVTSLELGLSAYHAFTMGKEAIITDVAKGISQTASGDFKNGLTSMLKAAAAPVSKYQLGKMVQAEYLHPGSNMDPRMQEIVDTMTKAGGRLAPRIYDPTYQYSAAGKFKNLWDVKQQALESVGNVRDALMNKGLLGGAPAAANEVVKGVGRIMQTAAAPIFEKYIPALKAGAYYDALGAWLDANPRAMPSDQVAMARKIGDSIDNRFGEMVQDNIFWNRTLKQSAMLGMRSYSWNLGTVREIGGGALAAVRNPLALKSKLDLRSNQYDPRTAYVVAMPMVVALTSAVYQYMKTGQPPDDVTDLMAPQTGGKTPLGAPERAILPGYEKDVYGWFNNPSQEAFNKIATAPRLLWETLTNQDYRGMPIANQNDPLATRLEQYLGHVVGSLGPISIRQQFQQPRGTGISRVEASTGIRPAPTWIEEPAAIKNIVRKHNQTEWNKKLRADARQQANRQ